MLVLGCNACAQVTYDSGLDVPHGDFLTNDPGTTIDVTLNPGEYFSQVKWQRGTWVYGAAAVQRNVS